MQTWDDILATAVVGTEQRELRMGAREDELGRLLAQISSTDREVQLLSAASVLGLYRNAGVVPPSDTQPLPETSDQEELVRCSRASGQHLELMLDGEFREVLPEWLVALRVSTLATMRDWRSSARSFRFFATAVHWRLKPTR